MFSSPAVRLIPSFLEKSRFVKYSGPALVLCFAVIALLSAYYDAQAVDRPGSSGEVAAPINVKTFNGSNWSLNSNKGKVVVVNFWASWCGPCNAEAPSLEAAYAPLHERGIEFIGIAVDDSEKDAKKFATHYGLTFPLALDATGGISDAYKVNGIPKTVIIGRDGRIKYIHMGVITPDVLAKELAKMMQ